MNLNYRLILASKSPRRQELLKSLDIDFEVKTRSVDESFPSDMLSTQVAEYLANKKSEAFGNLMEGELLITSDTVVIADDTILGKANDRVEADFMLRKLSASTHQVATGVCLRSKTKRESFTEVTTVTFDILTEEVISYYIDKYQPFDKAGAYGIQEWIGMVGISKIEGDYYNVMGLPLHRLYKKLMTF